MGKSGFRRKILKNGMTVLFEKRNNKVASFAFASKYGSLYEEVNEKGIAHFIEHMLYKGTVKRDSKQIAREIENKGGIINGFTGEQITVFWCKIPSKHMKIALEVFTDMIKNPAFDENEIEKERKVILEERKMWKDSPQLRVQDKIMECLYGGSLGMNPIGTEESIANIDKKKLLKRFEENYSSDSLIFCLVGDANFSELCAYLEKNFSKGKVNLLKADIKMKNEQIEERRKGLDQASLIFAYHAPKALDKKKYASQVLNTLMVGGMGSRLFQEIREKKNLAYAIKGSCNSDKDFGYNTIYVGTIKENLGKIKEIIIKEFRNIKDMKEKELEEAKEQLIGNSLLNKEESQGQMLDLLYGEIIGNVKEVYQYEKKVKSVNLSEIKKLAELKDYSIFSLVPD